MAREFDLKQIASFKLGQRHVIVLPSVCDLNCGEMFAIRLQIKLSRKRSLGARARDAQMEDGSIARRLQTDYSTLMAPTDAHPIDAFRQVKAFDKAQIEASP